MKKMLFAVLFVAIMAQSAMALSLSANGGVYVPQGSYGNVFNVGYDYGLSLEKDIFLFTSLKANYHKYYAKGKDGGYFKSGTELDGNAAELMLKVAPFDFIVEPYVAVGGGYYFDKITPKTGEPTRQNRFGFVGEAGLNINFFIFSVGLNAKYYTSKLNGDNDLNNGNAFTAGAVLTVHIPVL